MTLRTVAVYSDADRDAPHVTAANEAVHIGPPAASESYLRVEKIIEAARASGADAIHPGYGFLSENPLLAEACEAAGIVFVGPPAEAIRAMGDKALARQLAREAGVPVIPGYDDEDQSISTLESNARRIGFPLLLKPSAGGGGKGMRRVEREADLSEALEAARREARGAFGDERLILERYLDPIRHVEIQVFADASGPISLFERECSVQRRHQKIVEESPSTALSPELRARMGAAAVQLAGAVGYRGAGTVEFVLDQSGSFYFLEMNTRLQVEHPVTEMVTGLDLVHLQIREAMGEPVVSEIAVNAPRGHAIECRVYAEDPAQGFLPSVGTVLVLEEPRGPGIRFDSGIRAGFEIGVHYDPILAKLVVYADTRASAIQRLALALSQTVILGVQTNVAFLRTVIEHRDFVRGETYTDFVARHLPEWAPAGEVEPVEIALAALASLDAGAGGGSAWPHTAGAGTGFGASAGAAAAGTAVGVSAGFGPGGSGGAGDPFSPWNRFPRFRLSDRSRS
jgi:3-methylcrotonyl-CoA carboxylase alpha subunit